MDDDVTALVIPLFMVAGIGLYVWAKAARKRNARKDYQRSLGILKQNPTNPDLKGKALQLGRRYSNLMRNRKGVTIFDEMALANDINAACARSTVGLDDVGKVEVTNVAALSGRSVAQEIEKLGQLFLAGVVTAEEFERGKTLFLGAPVDKAASAVELLQNLDKLNKQGVLSDSEFRMKKWEILSERLLPGKMKAANLQPPPIHSPFPASSDGGYTLTCPACSKSMSVTSVASGSRYSCPHCQQSVEIG